MSELLASAAAALGIPEDLVRRSADARAAETGGTADDIIAAWAGGEVVAASSPPATEPSAAATPEEPTAIPEPAVTASMPIVEPSALVAQATTRAPVPDEVTPGEAAHLPEVITVPTAGIREKTSFVIPRWLTAVLLIVPAFALFALGGASTGQCGKATELKTDVVTGQIVNCDGSEFTGQSAGGGGTDYIALGADIYTGAAVAGVNCAGCHGANGQGAGAFPSLTGVLTTFGACDDHIEWVALGSSGFQGAGNDTYGDTSKPIGGGMPGFGSNLSAEQVAAISAFERVRFGGEDPGEALTDCGLTDSEDAPEGTEGADEDTTESSDEAEASIGHSG